MQLFARTQFVWEEKNCGYCAGSIFQPFPAATLEAMGNCHCQVGLLAICQDESGANPNLLSEEKDLVVQREATARPLPRIGS